MTRREFLLGAASACLSIQLPFAARVGRTVRAAVITDLHHGLAPDAAARFDAFLEAVRKRKGLDFVMQMGDFCHPGDESLAITQKWRELHVPQVNVLGNHDMDHGTKGRIMAQWGMREPYGAYEFGGFRLIVLDLNHFKKNGELIPYAVGNYFTDNATHNWASPTQLAWLSKELNQGDKPTILISHQPLGFAEKSGQPLPPEQQEVFDIVLAARKANPQGAVVACLCGHMHVDRLERVQGIPCLCLNSASYFWYQGMHAYRDPLYSFLELDPAGTLRVYGKESVFVKDPPQVDVVGMSASISDRSLKLATNVHRFDLVQA